MRGHFSLARTIWLKRCCFCHFTVPMLSPAPVSLAQSRRPREHRFVKIHAYRLAKQAQHSPRIFQHVFCIENRRRSLHASPDEIKNLHLLREAEVLERRVIALLDVRSNYFARIANKKAIRNSTEPFTIHIRQKVMCHLFLEKNSLPVRDGAGQLRDNFPPISFARSEHFIRDGMLLAGCTQVISIKRLVDDKSVSP